MQAMALWARLGSGGSSTLHGLAQHLCHFGHRLQVVRQAGHARPCSCTALKLWLFGQKFKRKKLFVGRFFFKNSEEVKAVLELLAVVFYVHHVYIIGVEK